MHIFGLQYIGFMLTSATQDGRVALTAYHFFKFVPHRKESILKF